MKFTVTKIDILHVNINPENIFPGENVNMHSKLVKQYNFKLKNVRKYVKIMQRTIEFI